MLSAKVTTAIAMEDNETARGHFRSQFAREVADSEVDNRPLKRGLSESYLLDIDLSQELNGSLLSSKLTNFASLATLPSEERGDEWLSPEMFRDILDKKERSLGHSRTVNISSMVF